MKPTEAQQRASVIPLRAPFRRKRNLTIQIAGRSGQFSGFQQARTPRDLEYDAFSRVTRGLLKARDEQGSMIRAASEAVELWTVIAADLADDGNALPETLRASLLSLAIFAIRQGHRIMAGNGGADALIDVNMSIMKGLRGEVAA